MLILIGPRVNGGIIIADPDVNIFTIMITIT